MLVDDFDYHLPEDLIAIHPSPIRTGSRLMVLPPTPGAAPLHYQFSDLAQFLLPGDLLVVNNTRVIPARLFFRRDSGGLIEVLLLRRLGDPAPTERWEAMIRRAKKIHTGEVLHEESGELTATLLSVDVLTGARTIELVTENGTATEALDRVGRMPVPPYIIKARQRAGEQDESPEDAERYQTVYARHTGSVAAPTAGLHFSKELIGSLKAMGVQWAEVTLHVGAGTFVGMQAGTSVDDHPMHKEWYEVSELAADQVNRARAEGRRVIAVGTTSVRTLESAALQGDGAVVAGSGETGLMIGPGFSFRAVDALITNFHLPRSTLMLLVSALVGRERILAAYEEAVRHRYRFYSYGDAMLLHRSPKV